MTDKPLPELLAPAGSEESLRAALAGGADAVYFGGAAFSNRMRAKNFAGDTIRNAIKLCHSVGAAAHITVNTRIKEREMDSVLAFADIILGGQADERADALIVADLGVARRIKAEFPHATLHASTQTSLSSVADCGALYSLGFSRLVVPRELSLEEIRTLAARSPIEIEMFIHGAHCVSCSGQCLLSYVMGGRSGNRGECAQPCRLPYTVTAQNKSVGGSYPLSMADMYLGGHIRDIISSGVASLKIEGRLKSSAYVYGVTRIYRRLLDERRDATADEKRALEDLFTRGFTDGYLTAHYSAMAGLKSSERETAGNIAKEISAALSGRLSSKRAQKPSATPIKARFSLKTGMPSRLVFSAEDVSAEAVGDIPQISTGNPTSGESAAKNLVKLGGSGFSLDKNDIEFDIDDGLWMPLSAINELRRRAADALAKKLAERTVEQAADVSATDVSAADVSATDVSGADVSVTRFSDTTQVSAPEKRNAIAVSAEIADLSLFLRGAENHSFAELLNIVSRLYVPVTDVRRAVDLSTVETAADTDKICAVLPVLSPDDAELAETLAALSEIGSEPCVRRVLCHTIGQVRAVRAHGLIADVSFRANVTNSDAAHVYRELGVRALTLSPELGLSAARDIAQSCAADIGLIGYGRLPVMHLSRCIISGGVCKKGNRGGRINETDARSHTCTAELCDRLGEKFPVIGAPDCTNVIYNSAVTWMGDRADQLKLGGYAEHIHFMFTTESADEACDVLRAYRRGEKRAGRRI